MDNLSNIGKGIVGVVSAVIGLAILAVILSRGATTVSVLGTFFSGLSSLIAVAVSPITGANTSQLAAAAAGVSATASGSYMPVSGYGFGSLTGSANTGGISIGGGNQNGFGSVSISGSALTSVASGISGLFSGSGSTGGLNTGGSVIPGDFSVGNLTGA